MRLDHFVIPRPIGKFVSLLPKYPPSLFMATALNLALGRVFPRDVLQPLTGKRVCIRVTDAGVAFNFTLTAEGFAALSGAAVPDLTISASARDFVLLALRKEDPDTLFFNRRLLMEGDTDLGLLVKNTLDSVELPKLDISVISPGTVLERFRSRILP